VISFFVILINAAENRAKIIHEAQVLSQAAKGGIVALSGSVVAEIEKLLVQMGEIERLKENASPLQAPQVLFILMLFAMF
jgi:hypothetical protein